MGKSYISATCIECGEVTTIECTSDQYERYHKGEELIQNIFPEVSPAIRETFISHLCPDCWDWLLSPQEPDTTQKQ